ncbi:transposase family protein [Azospirillum doebereinerae]|uniref:transposase family protein n=1 Tax=Azospirillum doebereinerae TaxID=92933 RepID=UPI001EE5CB88|nr:transposase family protein [Azospirillum doebereinerae]MCG5239201.1 transposase family protein [Azospirillum doebereinerae]
MPLDAPATSAAATNFPRWAEEPPVPPEGSLVPGSRFAEEQWVMAAGMLARGSSFLHVARALGCSRTTLWRAYYGSQPLRVRVWWERQALNREAELRLSSLRDLVAQQVERLVSAGDPATVRWAADRLGLFAAADAGLPCQPGAHLSPSPAPGEGRGPPRSGGKGEGLEGHGLRTTPDSPSPSPLRGSPPSPGAGEGFGVTGDRAAPAESILTPPAPSRLTAFDDDDAVPGAFREQTQPDPSLIAAILARPEADGPKGVYPWTLNPDDAYPSLGSAEERRGGGPCGWRGGGAAG